MPMKADTGVYKAGQKQARRTKPEIFRCVWQDLVSYKKHALLVLYLAQKRMGWPPRKHAYRYESYHMTDKDDRSLRPI